MSASEAKWGRPTRSLRGDRADVDGAGRGPNDEEGGQSAAFDEGPERG